MEQQYLEETVMRSNSFGEDKFCLDNQTCVSDADGGASHGFDCNICLDSVQDPVVTLCGHLFCWPCIYKWLHYKNLSAQQQCQPQENCCPVCKAEVSHASLVPLYGRFQTTNPSETKASQLGPAIPRRPLGPACGAAEAPASPSPQLHPHNYYLPHAHSYHPRTTQDYITSSMLGSSSITTNIIHPVIGTFGEAIYARAFGNTTTSLHTYPNSYGHVSNSSARLRRHMMQADESLSRICFFFFCCLVLCFLSF
ncbi:E3 ubiquitin-protein ligase RMA1H1-like [Momordica charantia]|uniref:E3 ubiquitin-protein ligase RMA n=1 Tax=Momordica charantia TaxID=3673 RepID=A0A6J1CHP4_MOMCH|nr:E3 ubiquitin-protein ligase RMA1H1-like [Momordica charantia]XP_022140293.1 E3 ubiquitin-protein ligase RMA1H1-like [Momordica charantia]